MTGSYKRIYLTPELLAEASGRAEALPVFENSHREHDANIVGCIGEVLFERLLHHAGIPFEDQRESTRHDYAVGDTCIDVKTKDRTVRPRAHFDNSVPLYNHEHQRPDYYYFVSLLRDPRSADTGPGRFTEGFLLGGISIGNLDRDGITWQAGQTDPSNGTTFWTACVNVRMGQLMPNADFIEALRRSEQTR